ncbi:MAG: hypothetical protein ACTSRB_13335, partial [Candidatus Helarchaeota archaeon]
MIEIRARIAGSFSKDYQILIKADLKEKIMTLIHYCPDFHNIGDHKFCKHVSKILLVTEPKIMKKITEIFKIEKIINEMEINKIKRENTLIEVEKHLKLKNHEHAIRRIMNLAEETQDYSLLNGTADLCLKYSCLKEFLDL